MGCCFEDVGIIYVKAQCNTNHLSQGEPGCVNSVQGALSRELTLEISVPDVEFFIALSQTLVQVSDSSQKLLLMDESGEPWQNVVQIASVLEIQLDENERCFSPNCLQILLSTSQ